MNELREMNLFLFVTNIVMLALIGALLPVIPVLTRKAFLFGVRVPEAAQKEPEALSLRRRYVFVSITGAAVLLALSVAQYVIAPDITLLALMYFPLLIIPLQMLAFVPCHKRAKRLKAERGWDVAPVVYAETRSSHTRGKLINMPWIYYALTLLVIVASVAVTLARYPQIPDPMPTHFDINMQPDAWAEKSLINVMVLPLVNLGTLLLLTATGISIEKVKLQVSTEDAALSFAQHRQYRRRMGHAMGIMTLGITAGMAIVGLLAVFPELNPSFLLIMLLTTAPVIPLVVVSLSSGQGGCRLKPKITDADRAAAGFMPESSTGAPNADDRFWALGMFYHNPDDPAILVEDRFGSNMGFNYSRLGVKIGVGLLLALMVAMYVWLTVIFRTLGVS